MATGDRAATATERLLWSRVRDVPDWPEPGVLFRDLTPLMADPSAFGAAVDLMAVRLGRGAVDLVVGVEARGFPYAAALAYHLGAGFVTLRKPGKLPGPVHSQSYALEYGSATLEIPADGIDLTGRRVVVIDDVLATGGTVAATVRLLQTAGATVTAAAVVLELNGLGGRAVLEPLPVTSLYVV